ncbi:MAG: TetR/AcrR family transcriptional regulator [Myxococcales bacterium]|nr:TetR/AcrR family transcriptional regulator [Myxococcales bacterium]
MGRKKGYEPGDLVESAVALFHAHGFVGTSTQMLVEKLGVNRNTMYAEFGSKQALFDAALRRYEQQSMDDVFGPLEAADADLDAIAALFARFGRDAAGPASGLGCLLCNTAVELAGDDSSGEPFVQRYFGRVQAAFQNALANARRAGDLQVGVVAVDEARFLTAAALGIFVMVRARTAPIVVQGAGRVAKRHLDTLRARNSERPTRA